MFWIVQTIVPIAVAVVLPVLIIWIVFRAASNKGNKNAEIIIKAIENNSGIDADKIIAALGKSEKSPLQLLQLRLLRGCIFSLLGIATAIFAAVINSNYSGDDIFYFSLLASGVFLAIGLAYLIVYFVSRKSVKEEKCQK